MKKLILTLSIAAVLFFSGCMTIIVPHTPSVPTQTSTAPSEQMRLDVRAYGAEESLGKGSIKCEFSGEGNFVYRFWDGATPQYAQGASAEGFASVPDDGIIASQDCRQLVIAQVDGNNKIIKYTCYDYIPGVRYYEGASPEYAALLGTVTNTAKQDYSFGYGEISLDYLAETTNGVNAGMDFYCHENEPFYSPVDGQITGIEGTQVNIYIPDMDCTLVIMNFSSLEQAELLIQAGGAVKTGELLGFTGGKGTSGFPEMHLELLKGRRTDYAGYASQLSIVRMLSLDVRILFDSRQAVTDSAKQAYVPYSVNAGGIAGYGLAARENGYIYYLNPKDGNRVYRMKNDGTQQEKITSDRAKFLTVCEGWLYYSAPSAGLYFYKCRTDGTDRTLVYKTSMSQFTVVGDIIYLETVTSSERLHVIGTDGTNYLRVSDQKVRSPFYYKGILYSCAVRHGLQVYTTQQTIGNEITYTYDKFSDIKATNLIIAEDYIYYTNHNDSDKLYRANMDGSEPKLIADVTVSAMNYYNGYLYFANVDDYSKIYSCKVDGTEFAKICDRAYSNDLCIAGDWMFYTTNTSSTVTYRYNLITGIEEIVK